MNEQTGELQKPKKYTQEFADILQGVDNIEDTLNDLGKVVPTMGQLQLDQQKLQEKMADQLAQMDTKLNHLQNLESRFATVEQKLTSISFKTNDIRDMQSHQTTYIGRDHSTGRFHFSFAWGWKTLIIALVAIIAFSGAANFAMARVLAKHPLTCQHILGLDALETISNRSGCGYISTS